MVMELEEEEEDEDEEDDDDDGRVEAPRGVDRRRREDAAVRCWLAWRAIVRMARELDMVV